jgi:hypothetical protein
MDYLRLRSRPTESDRAVRARLVGLIVGELGSVRRLVARPPGAEPLGAPRGPAAGAAAAGALDRNVERDLQSDLTS